ncbi:phage tail protein [Streptomyces sp. NPDC001393]
MPFPSLPQRRRGDERVAGRAQLRWRGSAIHDMSRTAVGEPWRLSRSAHQGTCVVADCKPLLAKPEAWPSPCLAGALPRARARARCTVCRITLNDEAGKPALRWKFTNAWPKQYSAPSLSATSTEVAIEELVLVGLR